MLWSITIMMIMLSSVPSLHNKYIVHTHVIIVIVCEISRSHYYSDGPYYCISLIFVNTLDMCTMYIHVLL